LAKNKELLSILPLATHNLGTVRDGNTLDLYDGQLRARRPDGTVALDFPVEDYAKHLFEEALPFSYTKQLFFRDPKGQPVAYRVGPLARLNCVDRIDTPLANAELAQFKEKCGSPCNFTVMNHYARLIELLYCAEKAVQLVNDDEIGSPNVRTPIAAKARSAIAHVEAPRGVLIHDYTVDENGIMRGANLIVATQHNISSINASIKAAADLFMKKPEEEFLNGIEFAIRCYDPCLSCSTHQIGRMPLDVVITRNGRTVRQARR
jgi:F420-non-reducing hydrogenase large subunit